jgi:hypothetical protein
MTQRIRCCTRFDITATGVKNHFNRARIPFQDDAGDDICDEQSWHHSRNKQRNWETMNAVMSLRTLPTEISRPEITQHDGQRYWQFDFTVDQPGALEINQDPVGALIQDCQGVPMHTGLDEDLGVQPCMIAQGSDINTWFVVLPD